MVGQAYDKLEDYLRKDPGDSNFYSFSRTNKELKKAISQKQFWDYQGTLENNANESFNASLDQIIMQIHLVRTLLNSLISSKRNKKGVSKSLG